MKKFLFKFLLLILVISMQSCTMHRYKPQLVSYPYIYVKEIDEYIWLDRVSELVKSRTPMAVGAHYKSYCIEPYCKFIVTGNDSIAEGLVLEFYPKSGRLSNYYFLKNDNREGEFVMHDKKGVVWRTSYHREDKYEGILRLYYKGRLFSETDWKNSTQQSFERFISSKTAYVLSEYIDSDEMDIRYDYISYQCGKYSSIHMKISTLNGLSVFFKRSGRMYLARYYDNGRIVKEYKGRGVETKLMADTTISKEFEIFKKIFQDNNGKWKSRKYYEEDRIYKNVLKYKLEMQNDTNFMKGRAN
jgi:hypothetical protein